jgi:hypothetical protein
MAGGGVAAKPTAGSRPATQSSTKKSIERAVEVAGKKFVVSLVPGSSLKKKGFHADGRPCILFVCVACELIYLYLSLNLLWVCPPQYLYRSLLAVISTGTRAGTGVPTAVFCGYDLLNFGSTS